MRNAGLDEPQAGIKIAGRIINNLRYADDTTLMAESEEDLKSPTNTIWHPLHVESKIYVESKIWQKSTGWFQIGKGVRQGCILSPWLFNLYPEYIMRNAGLDEPQAGIKIAGRNINKLRYADDHPYGRK